MEELLKIIHQVRPALYQQKQWFLLHNNASVHSAATVKQFLATTKVDAHHHPPYLLNHAPVDYFHFPTLRFSLKAQQFEPITGIQDAVTRELNS